MTEPVIQGDAFGTIKNERRANVPTARQVNEFHSKSDSDASTGAIHHTLGISHNQASPGDHSHDGQTSRLLASGRKLTIDNIGSTDAQRIQSIITFLHQVADFTEV